MSVFERRRFPVGIILLCVRWYRKDAVSDRDKARSRRPSALVTYIRL